MSLSGEGESRTLGPIKLTVPGDDALREVGNLLREGSCISALEISTADDLESATEKKLAWIGRIAEVLETIADSDAAAGYVDAVIPGAPAGDDPLKIHTAYFLTEMNQRLERLQTVREMIAGNPAAAQSRPPSPAPAAEMELELAPDAESGMDEVELNLMDEEAAEAPAASPAPAPPAAVAADASGEPMVVPVPRPKAVAASRPTPSRAAGGDKIIFIQCSRNGTARQAIGRFGSQMNLNLEIIDYNPDSPQMIVNQIFRHRDAKFAIVYWGEPAGRELPGLAHPERYVGFALGFALGRLGRGRCFIMGSTTAPPIPGFSHIPAAQLDSGGTWQSQLARRMKAANVNIDLSRLA